MLFALAVVCSCSNPSINTEANKTETTKAQVVESEDSVVFKSVETLSAEIDKVAMKQVGRFIEDRSIKSTIDYYHSGYEVERWSDKMWGRCCTEVDMQFPEWLGYDVSVSHEGSKYPFENALDADYNTAFVFEEKDNITITVKFSNDEDFWKGLFNRPLEEFISKEDTIMSKFQISLINGFSKSEKTFKENARVKEVELWLNGEHMCNVILLDKPDIQMITSNFPFFMDDKVELKPISIYAGSKYDDICISEIQGSLGYSCHPMIGKVDLY